MNDHQQTFVAIKAVLSGKIKTYAPQGYKSAIHKQPVEGWVLVTPEGICTDEQADRKVHGGKDKALHHYPFEHYDDWKNKLTGITDNLSILDKPGAFGENISSLGLTEDNVCFCDCFSIGDELVVQVSQTRQPCWKLNQHFDAPEMSLYLQQTGKTGWYYRVLQDGYISTQSTVTLLERPYPQWTLKCVNQVMFADKVDKALLEAFLELPLTPSWRATIEKRLSTNSIEDMNRRLYRQF